MRTALLKKLTGLMETDQSVYLLTADTGFHVFDDYPLKFPGRFLNVGICEAAMIGLAAGLAIEGKRVFVYGIVPFVTMRCFEQIRVDLCYPSLPVTIIGVGGGLTYGPAGMTHHSIEDIALMNCLPNMTVICPGDAIETEHALDSIKKLQGPCYLRLGKTGEPVIHPAPLNGFAIGKGISVSNGSDFAIIATGNMLPVAMNAGRIMKDKGLNPHIVSMHTLKPVDRDLIIDLASKCHTIATVEEHNIIGGLGSIVADVLTDENLKVKLKKFAINDQYAQKAGSQQFLRSQYGLTAENIAKELS